MPPGLLERPYEFLRFGNLLVFDAPVGIDDKAWLRGEDTDVRRILSEQAAQLPML